jgi:hypothetical protein
MYVIFRHLLGGTGEINKKGSKKKKLQTTSVPAETRTGYAQNMNLETTPTHLVSWPQTA